jgi:hypothetical protein
MTRIAKDKDGQLAQCVGLGAAQVVDYDSSTQSTAFGLNTRIIRVVATTDCHVAIGSNPTATTSSTFLPIFTIEYFKVAAGDKIAAIKNASAGKLYVTECD